MGELAPLSRFLDPRPAHEVVVEPISDSVNIPLDELPYRMHELPPRYGRIEVACPEPLATETVMWLSASGRDAQLARDWEYAPPGTRSGRLWKPNDFLVAVATRLEPGTALDLACGTGRDAVYLASLGWEVTAIDHLADALDRGRDLARRYLSDEDAGRIRWLCKDLSTDSLGGSFDLVNTFWFLDRDLIRTVPALLNPGGSFVMETFTTTHRERYGKPRTESFALQLSELRDLLPGLRVESYDEDWHGDRHSARFWGKV